MGTVVSNKRTAETASLNNDATRECDTTPGIPINLIFHLILPFLDRPTWNAVRSANKELHEAGMSMTPPWPASKLRLGHRVGALKFSSCGSFLAYGVGSSPHLLHICDRHGRQTCLRGHTSHIFFLSFSNDGKYLASADRSYNNISIRIWPINSTTRLLRQKKYIHIEVLQFSLFRKYATITNLKQLRGHEGLITCLDFSPRDSNILASGDTDGCIKLWNVEQEVCIYSFAEDRTGFAFVRSLYFPDVQNEGHKCIFVTSTGSLIRTWWNDLSDIESDIVDMPGLGQVWASAFSHCGSLIVAAPPYGPTVALYTTCEL
jgi:WD40 repeat protein